MSARRLVTIFCDVCDQWEEAGVGDTAREARLRLRLFGWQHERSGQDICPKCCLAARRASRAAGV